MSRILLLVLLAGLCATSFGQVADDAEAAAALKTRIESLVKQLGADDFADRESATNALFEIGNPARNDLELALKSDDPEVALRAAGILERFPKLTHMVVDALGAPLPLAQVTLRLFKRTPAGDVASEDPPTVSIADDRGRIGMPPLPDASFRVVALIEQPNYGRARFELQLHSMATTLQVPLVRRGTEASARAVTGVVVDADGKPVMDALITCNEVRTPGQGLINGNHPRGEALSDSEGRFAFYLPNTNAAKERGELIPQNSHFSLRISVPGNDSHFPLAGTYGNKEPVRLELRHAARHFRLRFEAPGGGAMIADAGQLAYINVQNEITQNGERTRIPLDQSVVSRGAKLPTGKYLATFFHKGSMVHYQPIVVTDDSPDELVFRLPPALAYQGRVLHGVTNEPVPGAIVIGFSSTSRNNLALLTPEDWKLLSGTDSNPPAESPALKRLGEFYGVKGFVRTNAEGRFEITRNADQEFYGLIAFGEDFVPYDVTVGSLKPNDKQVVDTGDFPLFPAAKVLVRPVFEGQRLSVCPEWLLEKEGQPDWIERFREANKGYDRRCEYVHWLAMNESQPLYVPAGIRLRVKFDTPYDDKWAPTITEAVLQLKAGATHEVGDLHFAACFPAAVHVVDKAGKPVEGVPMRRKYADGDGWCVAHNTDKDGLAHFHLRPNSQGQFWASNLPGSQAASMASNLYGTFAIKDKSPAEPYSITVTDEQIQLWRGAKK